MRAENANSGAKEDPEDNCSGSQDPSRGLRNTNGRFHIFPNCGASCGPFWCSLLLVARRSCLGPLGHMAGPKQALRGPNMVFGAPGRIRQATDPQQGLSFLSPFWC